MNLFTLVFGEKPRPVLTDAPANADWRAVRPKPNQKPVLAHRAEADCTVETANGQLKARGGHDYIAHYGPDDKAVIRGDIFTATYEPLGGGLYRKRSDIVLRYFTLDHACVVETMEGPQHAKPGDWIMQGVQGELWPMPAEKAEAKYDPA
jgi:hypothetical protein